MKVLIYADIGNIDTIDTLLGAGVDDNIVDKYAVLTIDGSPVIYEHGQDSAHEELSGMAIRCAGITEE